MGRCGDRFRISRQRLGHDLLSHGKQILLKIHRTDPQVAQPTHRHRNVAEGKLQQGACRHDVKLRHFLVKIPQRRQGPRTGLDLIQEKQGLPWHNPSADDFQGAEDSGRIEIFIENRSQIPAFFKIDFDKILKQRSQKSLDQPSLAHLPCAAEHQRFAMPRVFPREQLFFNQPFHNPKLPPKLQNCKLYIE